MELLLKIERGIDWLFVFTPAQSNLLP